MEQTEQQEPPQHGGQRTESKEGNQSWGNTKVDVWRSGVVSKTAALIYWDLSTLKIYIPSSEQAIFTLPYT